jgi:hypothetical protein
MSSKSSDRKCFDRNDFDAGFLITFRKKSKFTLQKAMIFGQNMTIIIITIIKHHNSKHYIYSIFIKTGLFTGNFLVHV